MNILFNALLVVHLSGGTTVYHGDITALNLDGVNGGIEMNVQSYEEVTTDDIFSNGMDPGYGHWEVQLHTPELHELHYCYASVSIADGIVDLDCAL